jgi:formyl-CoA transferase
VIARNKRTITCNLRTEEGQQIVRALVKDADVLIENFRTGTLERWGLSPEALHEINPRLIITRVTGYGQDGPYSARAGYGSIGEAMGGVRYVTGNPEAPPSRAGISLGDQLAAVFATVGTLAALHDRERTGRGQVVDSAIYEAVLAMMESLVPEWQLAGYTRERTGATLPGVAPSNVYPARRGEMVLIAANQDTVFRRLCEVMGRPELADDPRFRTHDSRGDRMQELDSLIAAWTATHEIDALLTKLHESGIPAGLIYTAKDMLADPHFAAREAIVTLLDQHLGEIKMQNVFPKLSAAPGRVRHAGGDLGQDNDSVYRELLGLSEERLKELRDSGII